MERLPIISHNSFRDNGFHKSRSPSSPYSPAPQGNAREIRAISVFSEVRVIKSIMAIREIRAIRLITANRDIKVIKVISAI